MIRGIIKQQGSMHSKEWIKKELFNAFEIELKKRGLIINKKTGEIETINLVEPTELLLVQDECQELFNADADNFIPVNLGVDFKYVSYWADADASNFIFCESKKPETDSFGTAEQVVSDLLKERVKSIIHTKKNKKADYKNKKYENKAKKAELSPLLKNLIKNIK